MMITKPTSASFAFALCLAAFATSAGASTTPIAALHEIGTPILLAKRGADDPAGDKRRGRGTDDGPGHASILVPDAGAVLAKRGADDPAGDKRRGRRTDDGPGHA